MSGARHRQKGDRVERELVDRHKAIGVHAERYPLSGASRFRGSGHDVETSIRLAVKRHPWSPRSKPAKTDAALRNSSAGSASSTCCSFAVIMPIPWCCCPGACGPRCFRRFRASS